MKKILLVEDEKPLRGVVSDKLTKEGFEVVVAKNGLDGLNQIVEEKPDLVILDIVMPVMDGITMIKEMNEKHLETPFIVLSNLSDDEAVNSAMQGGSLDFLVKTEWKLDDIVSKVREILEK